MHVSAIRMKPIMPEHTGGYYFYYFKCRAWVLPPPR